MLRRVLKKVTQRMGIYARLTRELPAGVDWMVDVDRLLKSRRPNVILDVGANIGQTSIELRSRFPSATVHAFEPVSSTFAELVQNTGCIPGIVCHNVGLSSSDGSTTMCVVPKHLANSLKPLRVSQSPDARTETVELATLDSFAIANSLSEIELLKSDTEGHDLEVLRGGARLIRDGKVLIVYCEVTFDQNDLQHTSFFEVFSFLRAYDYSFGGLYELAALQNKNPWGESYCNALFLSPLTQV